MKRPLATALFFALLALCLTPAGSQAQSSSGGDKLPVSDHKIPMDLSAWKRVFSITKTSYNKDDNNIVFLVKAKKTFNFQDDGYDAPFQFIDKDGVNLTTQKNVTWEHDVKTLRIGEATRVTLELPDEETLGKAKKCKAVVKGFFNK